MITLRRVADAAVDGDLDAGRIAVAAAAAVDAGEVMLTVDEVATRLGVCTETIRRAYQSGRLRAVRVGRLVRIPAAAVAAYVSPDHVRAS